MDDALLHKRARKLRGLGGSLKRPSYSNSTLGLPLFSSPGAVSVADSGAVAESFLVVSGRTAGAGEVGDSHPRPLGLSRPQLAHIARKQMSSREEKPR
jgi:hypothetical protein